MAEVDRAWNSEDYMRRAARVDGNQSSLVAELRKIGACVYPTHTVGGGFPDLVVAYCGRNYLVEVKDPSKPPSRRRLTKEEQDFFDSWSGPKFIVESLDGFLDQIKEHEARVV